MPDLIYVLTTLVAFALLALLVGALGRRLDDADAGVAPTGPAKSHDTEPAGR
ncbi:hypothetical protein [Marmoricola endophyticus]|uniref:hypothetical protein n=1 Tax=Marmoricola endophyticus TaxID=2040280 RepID=UPI0016656288|nr:hypothetical protein [Marmoricola endophyticus]